VISSPRRAKSEPLASSVPRKCISQSGGSKRKAARPPVSGPEEQKKREKVYPDALADKKEREKGSGRGRQGGGTTRCILNLKQWKGGTHSLHTSTRTKGEKKLTITIGVGRGKGDRG